MSFWERVELPGRLLLSLADRGARFDYLEPPPGFSAKSWPIGLLQFFRQRCASTGVEPGKSENCFERGRYSGQYYQRGNEPLSSMKLRFRLALLNRRLVVFDIIYNPLKTRLLEEAEKRGARVISGSGDAGLAGSSCI